MPLKEEVLGQFLGDEKFPIEWASETEKLLFWVYDDLHCPHPLSPMYEDIGGWWMSCDHMFRRFGTPFATDWILKNVNGWCYTAAIPAEAGLSPTVFSQEYGSTYHARVPLDPAYADKIGAYLGAVLPTYGNEFATWWNERLVPEMKRNFAYIEGKLDQQEQMNLMQLACLLEDMIDIHDRHWKIHWMLNFAQLSATLNLRAVMEKTHGKIDEELLGRLQNSAKDRNWDSIEALWKMKEEVKADAELAATFKAETADEIIAGLKASERGKRFIAERVQPYQREYGYHAVWSHEFIFPNVVEQMEPVIELVRGYIQTNYDYPKTMGTLADDIAAAAEEILQGLQGEALEEMRAANDINLKMAPLTPDHHFYIDQGANAHMRQVLLAIGRKLVAHGRPRRAGRRRLLPLQRAACLHGRPGRDLRPRDRRQGQGCPREGLHVPAEGLDRDRDEDPAGLPVPEPVGLPREVLPQGIPGRGPDHRPRRLAGRRRRHRPGGPPRGPVR